jgi:hypothetical protein
MVLSIVRVPDETGAEASPAPWPPAARGAPDAGGDSLALPAPSAVPIDTGRWGRPPAVPAMDHAPAPSLRRPDNRPRHRHAPGATTSRLYLVPPPPPPPPPVRRRPARTWTARLRSSRLARHVAVELAVAAALVAAVALVAGAGPGSGPAPVPASSAADAASPAVTAWEQEGIPTITAIVDDLTAATEATANPSTVSTPSLSAAATRLATDLAGAQRIGTPPASTGVRALWGRAMSDLAAGLHSLTAASASLSPAAVSLAHQQFVTAGNELLGVAQKL